MTTKPSEFHCWKCKDYYDSFQGKTSKEGTVFTCFGCLRSWYKDMRPVWKNQASKEKKEFESKALGQMDIFSQVEIINSVF